MINPINLKETFLKELLNKKQIDVNDHGFFCFYPDLNNSGYYDAHVLRAIADKLDELNKTLNKSIDKYFKKETK